MPAMPIAVQGKEAGEIFIPALGRGFKQVQLREDDLGDSVMTGSGAISAGTEYVLFRDVANKNEQHSTFKTSRKLDSGMEAVVFRVGVHPRGAHGNVVPLFVDVKKLLENAILQLKFNTTRIVAEGPLIKYQSGYGIGGFSQESGATAATVGVPSAAAAPTLFVPQNLNDKDDVYGIIKFPDAQWISSYSNPNLSGVICVSLFMRSVIKTPVGA